MKTLKIYRYMWLMILMTGWITAKAQYQQEVPGDNFSLEGALELFKQSESPEEFERKLNDPDARVNNLDLNGDGYIDYIRVIDMYERDVHAFVLQAVISKKEFQDIAVITLEKQANGHAVLQITGDADIYGVETIIEPTTEVRTYAGTTRSRVVVNVWSWPMVRYVYSPYYSVWVSPWAWGYNPHWWRPWRPVYYYDYYTYWSPYRSYYSVCYSHRVVYAHKIYAPHRTTSVIVHNNYHPTIVKYRTNHIDNDGNYRRTRDDRSYSRPTSAVRYDANGRIRSNSSNTEKERTYTSSSNRSRSSGDYQRGSERQNTYRSNNNEYRTNRGQGRSSGNRNENSYKENPRNDRGYSTGNQRQSSDRPVNSGNSINKSNERSYGRSSGNSQGSSNTPKVQRSSERSNSSTVNRSSGNANTQRYSGRSSNAQRSSGNSNVQRSSGSSNRSSGSSNVQRSNGSSNSQKSSGRSSSSSNSSRSSSSKSNSRNRH